MHPARVLLSLGALAVSLALTACAGVLDAPERFGDASAGIDTGPACIDVTGDLFPHTCATTGCHTAKDLSGNLDLQSPNIPQRLVAKSSSGGAGLLIDPGAPENSILYRKLKAAPPFGSRMPLTGTPLDDATATCVLTWIKTVALDAGAPVPTEAGTDAGVDASDASLD